MSSSFNDVTFWKVYLECSLIFFHVIVMSSSFNDVTFLKVYLESSNIFFQVLWCHHPFQWCHILESLFRIFKHILSWIVMSSSFNDVTYWNVRLVRVDTSSVLLQYTHTWQSLLSWIFATYLFVFQNNASFKEYGWSVFIYFFNFKKKKKSELIPNFYLWKTSLLL